MVYNWRLLDRKGGVARREFHGARTLPAASGGRCTAAKAQGPFFATLALHHGITRSTLAPDITGDVYELFAHFVLASTPGCSCDARSSLTIFAFSELHLLDLVACP